MCEARDDVANVFHVQSSLARDSRQAPARLGIEIRQQVLDAASQGGGVFRAAQRELCVSTGIETAVDVTRVTAAAGEENHRPVDQRCFVPRSEVPLDVRAIQRRHPASGERAIEIGGPAEVEAIGELLIADETKPRHGRNGGTHRLRPLQKRHDRIERKETVVLFRLDQLQRGAVTVFDDDVDGLALAVPLAHRILDAYRVRTTGQRVIPRRNPDRPPHGIAELKGVAGCSGRHCSIMTRTVSTAVVVMGGEKRWERRSTEPSSPTTSTDSGGEDRQ